ncbi:MAG TPA: Ig-like domain-containing protein [Candidatus Dormibacteraeota bacterium]|nr:Ig-like domain-containing protein [Candidatus Dormibacteraeota bacterium]
MISTRPRLLPAVLVAVLSALALGACSGSTATGEARSGGGRPLLAPPVIAISPGDGDATVRLDAPVKVSSLDGRLDAVVLHSLADPTPLTGQMAADHSSWTSSAFFDPATAYVVEATAHAANGLTAASRANFKTEATGGRLTASTQPADGSTVGVGMPVILHFNSPIPPERQQALVQRLTVQSTPSTIGAWHWFAPTEVHWRPREFWQPGTRVTVGANLRGLDAGNDVWGLGDFNYSFTIGDKHISTIDLTAHQMSVTANDQVVHTYPISAGRTKNPTLTGVLVVRYRQYDVLMDSESIGIPRYAPDGYYEHVYWDTAISTDGFFIHSAPWSMWAQGSQNVSHGCVNLSPQRAQEFYEFSQIGDVVQVLNGPRVADAGDGEGDWQIPFDQFANSGAGSTTPAPGAGPGGGL